MDWTDDAILRLRKMWDEGLSTAEIGRRFGITKNAVVGKVHRLELSARPSPIRRDPAAPVVAHVEVPRRVGETTLPAPESPARVVSLPAARAQESKPAPARPLDRPVPVVSRPSLVAAMAAPVRLIPRTPACCWPIGEPGTPEFRFCSEPALANKPYCQPHAEIAYVRVRDRREEAA